MDQRIDNHPEIGYVKKYIGGNKINNDYYFMYKESEREFVVTHNTNIKPVSYFTGRETELDNLRQRIEEGRRSVLVSGMGGIGKTQICRKLFEEYLARHTKNGNEPFQHIGYIEYNGDMSNSLQNCLKFKEQDSLKKHPEAAWRELEYLASDGKLLIFVDNVDKPMGEDRGLQRLNTIPGSIILTSRLISFSDEFEPYPIGFLDTKQCVEIFERIRFKGSRKMISTEEIPDLKYIIETLVAKHTITIELLAHLAKWKNWSIKNLKDALEEKGFRLEFRKDGELVNIQEAYEKLYNMSKLTEAEKNILEAFSVFPYIPLAAETCNEWLLTDAEVNEDDEILMQLYQKGWLQFDMDQESYALHPVFAQFICEKCKPSTKKHRGLIEACQKSLKIPESGSVLECKHFIPFAENIIEKFDIMKDIDYSEFISVFAFLLQYMEEYENVEKLYKRLLDIELVMFGENHLNTAKSYSKLANLYVHQRDYAKAQEFCELSIKIKESLLGKNHPDVIDEYSILALVYEGLGEFAKAKELLEKNLQLKKSQFGENHPCIAAAYNNLGIVYEKQGDYKKAEEVYKKGITIFVNVLGKNHPEIVGNYINLAAIFFNRGAYKKAEKLYEESLAIYKSVLGDDHPKTVKLYYSLASVFIMQKNYKIAEEFFEKALQIQKKETGENHPYIASSYERLAYAYLQQKQFVKAEELYEKSLRIRENIFEDNHPEIADSYFWMACIYRALGKYSQAEELYIKSLRIRASVFGEDNIETASSYFHLAMLYDYQREHLAALSYYFKAYKVFKSKLGLTHPDTQKVYCNMKSAYTDSYNKSNFEQWLEDQMKE